MQRCEQNAMAAVGDAASIMAFRSLGVRTRAVSDAQSAAAAIVSLAREGYRIILVTEQAAQLAQETIDSYVDHPFPIILTIPDRGGSSGYGMRKIQSNMERAIGTTLADDAQKEE